MTYAIQAEGLVKKFKETTALAGVDLAARTGTVLGVLGPNGAGKTTAVRVLATLLRPDAGRASVKGYDVIKDAHVVRKIVGLTGQYASVDELLTGTENLVMIGRLLNMPRREARARAAQLLDQFDLTEAKDRSVTTYSGGMRRRLDLAASLVGRPAVLFLDEPTTGLDPSSRLALWGVLRELVGDGLTVLLTTQYLDEADQLADDITVIDNGAVIASGTPAELKASVSGQDLSIQLADPGHAPRAAALVGEFSAAPTVEGSRITVPVGDPSMAARIIRRLDEDGVPLTDFALRSSTLDEVFLALTGKKEKATPKSPVTELPVAERSAR